MQITSHFDLEEFHCRDGTPYPKEWIKSRLLSLCKQLEIIREHFGNKPMVISSGYRTNSYNRKINGARRSQHLLGKAADFKVKGLSPRKVALEIRELIRQNNLSITGLGSYKTFTHVDIRDSNRLVYWIY